MTLAVYVTFAAASLVLALAPGPDNLFVLVQSSVFGARAGLFVVAGLLCGITVQTLAAALGIAAVVAASPLLFWGIRILGAIYLLYLAWMAWRAKACADNPQASRRNAVQLWRRGFIMNITNPKVVIFFLAFFPQFVTAGAGSAQTALEMVVLGLTFMLATAVVFGSIALLAGTISDRLRTPKIQFWLNRTSAVIFVALAAFTVFSS